MKFLLFLTLLFGLSHSCDEQKTETFEYISLKLCFPSSYNDFAKTCCKFYYWGCYPVASTKGNLVDPLRKRVTKTEKDGSIEFKIWNIQPVDSGQYRCIVEGTQNHIYKDYNIEISEDSHQPTPRTITTIKPLMTTRELSDATGLLLIEDHSSPHSSPWHFGLPLAVAVSAAIVVAFGSLVVVVCRRVKAKKRCHESTDESLKHNAPPETNGVVYTTVEFRPHQSDTELYANLSMPSPGAAAPDPSWSEGPEETVEYSTLAISP